jgi:hypothetical protein
MCVNLSLLRSGYCNSILQSCAVSLCDHFIGAGYKNRIEGGNGNFIGSGDKNFIFRGKTSSIVGGKLQTIRSTNSSILSGYNNQIQLGANCSVIIGGSLNTILPSHPVSAIFGTSINTVSPNTLHIECLNAVNTPIFTSGIPFPVGTVFRCALGATLPPGAERLYIQQ